VRKSHIRDYATAAFAFYAREGSSAKYKKAIWDEAVEKQHKYDKLNNNRWDISDPTQEAISRADAAVRAKKAELADLEAVEYAINVIESMSRWHLDALRAVYMAEPHRDPERGEISQRVDRAAVKLPADPSTIYRWLADARRAFAEARGLRV
jgi:hypothetical protein